VSYESQNAKRLQRDSFRMIVGKLKKIAQYISVYKYIMCCEFRYVGVKVMYYQHVNTYYASERSPNLLVSESDS
jgi:hypothetical protein